MILKKTLSTARRVSALVKIAGAAKKARSATDEESRHAARRALAGLLSDARGLPMKVGQVLASGEADDPFAALVKGIDPLPFEVIEPVLEREWERAPKEVIETIEASAKAASLGQVHRALLRTGEPVAIKVRYPDIADAIEAELRLAGLMPGVGPVRKWGFEIDAYRRVLRENMARELDYRIEAAQQIEFRERSAPEGLIVPRVYEELTTSAVLVQSWEVGESIDALADWPRAPRLQVGRILLETLFQSVFRGGLVHGDPHAGNYFFRREGDTKASVVLVDYGCVLRVPEPARLALLKLILWTREGGSLDPLACFAAMGFDAGKLGAIDEALPELCEALFAPFVGDGPFATSDWRLGERVEASLGELRWWFRSAGPPELFLLMRAFHGLFHYLDRLGIVLPWWPLLVRSVPESVFDAARAFEPESVQRDRVSRSTNARAKLLRVEIHREGEDDTVLSMPAREALKLSEVIPDDVRRRIEQGGVDLVAIEARARDTRLAPQLLFNHREPGKAYRVWLE